MSSSVQFSTSLLIVAKFTKRYNMESKNNQQGVNLTPYQGKSRTFGEYKCNNCGNKWSSGNSWANMSQTCKSCRANVYPYKQEQLSKKGNGESKSPHPQELCQKCRQLGRLCRTY